MSTIPSIATVARVRRQWPAAAIVGFLLLTASAGAGQIGSVKEMRPSQSGERQLPVDTKFREWARTANQPDDAKRVQVCRVEAVCKMRFKEGETPRTRVRNLVAPLHYEDETVNVTEDFTRQVRQALETTAKDLGANGRDSVFGHGAVDVLAAAKELAPEKFGSPVTPVPQIPSGRRILHR